MKKVAYFEEYDQEFKKAQLTITIGLQCSSSIPARTAVVNAEMKRGDAYFIPTPCIMCTVRDRRSKILDLDL